MKSIGKIKEKNPRSFFCFPLSPELRRLFSVCSIFFYSVMLTACPLSDDSALGRKVPLIQSFKFEAKNNVIEQDLEGRIDGGVITVDVPNALLDNFKTALSGGKLVPTFESSFQLGNGSTGITVDGVPQISGVTANDFTGLVIYSVIDPYNVTGPEDKAEQYEVVFKNTEAGLFYIPDPVLREFMKRKTPAGFNGDWLNADHDTVKKYANLRLLRRGGNLRSIEGIQYYTALESLSVVSHKLSRADLTGNPGLVGINLAGNRLISIEVRANPKIKILNLNNNNLKSINLSGNPELVSLKLGRNQLTSIDVSTNKGLGTLHLAGNRLISVDVSRNLKLTRLDLSDNEQLRTADMRGMRGGPTLDLKLDGLFALRELKVHKDIKDHESVRKIKKICGRNLTIEVYDAAPDSTDYTLEDGNYMPRLR